MNQRMNPLERITNLRIECPTLVGCDLPEGAGPADWWLATLIDPSASAARRDEAARELRRLGARAIREAQDRRSAMEEDRWWASLSEAEQRELLRKESTDQR